MFSLLRSPRNMHLHSPAHPHSQIRAPLTISPIFSSLWSSSAIACNLCLQATVWLWVLYFQLWTKIAFWLATLSPPLLIFRPIRFFVYMHTTIVANKWWSAEVRGICTGTVGATSLIGSSNLVKLAGIIDSAGKKNGKTRVTMLSSFGCPDSTGCYYWCFVVLLAMMEIME